MLSLWAPQMSGVRPMVPNRMGVWDSISPWAAPFSSSWYWWWAEPRDTLEPSGCLFSHLNRKAQCIWGVTSDICRRDILKSKPGMACPGARQRRGISIREVGWTQKSVPLICNGQGSPALWGKRCYHGNLFRALWSVLRLFSRMKSESVFHKNFNMLFWSCCLHNWFSCKRTQFPCISWPKCNCAYFRNKFINTFIDIYPKQRVKVLFRFLQGISTANVYYPEGTLSEAAVTGPH